MGKWFRCPVCGRLCLERNIDREFPAEVFNQVGLGRARGFRYDPIFDMGLIKRIKNKIKDLYTQYFIDEDIQIRVPVVPRVFLRESPRLPLNPPTSLKVEVKMVD